MSPRRNANTNPGDCKRGSNRPDKGRAGDYSRWVKEASELLNASHYKSDAKVRARNEKDYETAMQKFDPDRVSENEKKVSTAT
jgi:hypothetical protein